LPTFDKFTGQSGGVSISLLNAMVDTVNRPLRTGVRGSDPPVSKSGDVLVYNASGAARDRFAVLCVEDYHVKPHENLADVKNNPIVKGVAPDTDYPNRAVVILQEPIAESGIATGRLAGASLAYISVLDSTHEYAAIKDAETGYLESATSGAIKIICKGDADGSGSGSDLNLAVVQMPVDNIRPLYKATADETTGRGDVRTVDAKRVGADGTVDESADAVELTIQDDVPEVWVDDLLITQHDRHGATVAVLTDKYPIFGYATSDPSGGTLTIKKANSDGTLVGSDITVYDGGIT